MRILIGCPTYDRRIDIELARTLIHIERQQKHDIDYLFPISSHLARNRNMCASETLKGNHDALLFLDSDMGIIGNQFLDTLIETAYKFDAKIVGGAYRMKKEEMVYVAGNFKEGKMDNIKEVPKMPMIVEGVGTGIMLIFREVFEKLQDPWFTIIDKSNFEVMPEDFEFCRKAREAGFTIALDPRFETHHWGTHAWIHSLNMV